MTESSPRRIEPLRVAFVGGGPGALAVMDILAGEHLRQSPMTLVGIADINPRAPALQRAQAAGIFTTGDFRELFTLTRLDLLIELTGDKGVLRALEREKPGRVGLMDHTAARLFWDVIRLGEEKRSAEKRYKDLFDLAREGLALFNEQGEIVECNFSLAHMLGYTKAEMEHLAVWEIAVKESKKILRHHLGDLRIMGFTPVEMDFLKSDGEVLPVEADIAWLPEERLFRMVARDITTRRKLDASRKAYAEKLEREVARRTEKLRLSEEETRRQKRTAESIIYGSPIPMFIIDGDHRIVYWNKACERLTGRSSDEMIGTDRQWEPFYPEKRPLLADLIIDGDMEAIEALYRDQGLRRSSLVEGALEAENFFPGLGKSGAHLYMNAVPITDDDGAIQGAIVAYQDFTERIRLQAEKDRAERMAAVGMTVAGLAHYIKNILTGLKGGSYVIRSALSKKDVQLLAKGWGMMERNIDQIASIVTDMLIYSRDARPAYEMVDPNALVRAVVELMAEKARISGVRLLHELSPAVSEVPMDRMALHRCLLDLVSNAIDACALEGILSGKGIVTVSTGTTPDGGVAFHVSDNGMGMDEATQKRLFTDFFTTKGYKGTGLGLPVTHKIVQDHGGSLVFETQVGQGTRFVLALPGNPPREPGP